MINNDELAQVVTLQFIFTMVVITIWGIRLS